MVDDIQLTGDRDINFPDESGDVGVVTDDNLVKQRIGIIILKTIDSMKGGDISRGNLSSFKYKLRKNLKGSSEIDTIQRVKVEFVDKSTLSIAVQTTSNTITFNT